MNRFLSIIVVFTILSISIFPSSYSVPYGFPNLSWGWRTDNYTKVTTAPSVLKNYQLIPPYRQCSSGMEGIMTRLAVYPCASDNGRCQLRLGDNVKLELWFMANIPAESLMGSMKASWTRWYLPPVSLVDPEDLCKSENITCPIQPHHWYRYGTNIYIRPTLPALSPDITILIKTKSGRSIACAIVPVAIIGPERNDLSHQPFPLAAGTSQ